MALIDGLISYHKLDENAANTTVADSHASLTGTANTNTSNMYDAAGKINSAFNLNGSEFVELAGSGSLAWGNTNEFTMAAWITTTGTGSFMEVINNRFGGAGIHLEQRSDNTFGTFISDGSNNAGPVVSAANAVNDGNFHHVIISNDGSALKLYIDGVYIATTDSSSVGSLITSSTIYFGARSTGTPDLRWTGKLDEIPMWNRALTDGSVSTTQTAGGEIAELYNSGDGFAYPFAAGTNMSINIGDVFKGIESVKINIGNDWRPVIQILENIGDDWKTVFG